MQQQDCAVKSTQPNNKHKDTQVNLCQQKDTNHNEINEINLFDYIYLLHYSILLYSEFLYSIFLS